jgi:lipoate---protein ligase
MVTQSEGDAGPFHARQPADDPPPSVWVHRVGRPALVLGSSQPHDVVDHRAAAARGIEVARRRSGGGLVLVHPEHSRWVDVIVPRQHPHWVDDVGHAFDWLGRAWADAIRSGLAPADAGTVARHRGPMLTTPWSALLCFAGLGPGEVTVAGSKVVGMSQRRTRGWSRFQCLVVGEPDLALLDEVVAPAARPGPAAELRGLPIGHRLDVDAVLATFLDGFDPT